MRRLLNLPLYRRDSIGQSYHVLTFETPGGLDAKAGQFAMVRGATWGDAPLLPRPMSLLTSGERPSILIKVVGEGTARMAHASSGEPFTLLAPLGEPWAPCPHDHVPLLVAGGVGVAPLLFLARELSAHAHRPVFLYGGRTMHDLPLSEDLSSLADLRIATEDGSRGERGRVTRLLEEALEELSAQGKKAKVYTCGPDPMMAAVAKICRENQVLCDVSLETPMACGYGVCLGCPVAKAGGGFFYACTEGPCVDATRIAWRNA